MDKSILNQFGIMSDDELPHPYSEAHYDWNESYFFDWYDETGSNAGHCRIGWHPVQERVLFWLYLFNGNEWLVIEEFRLPFSTLQLGQNDQAFAYDSHGLHFSYQTQTPLYQGCLKVSGFARVMSGKRAGMVLPVDLELDVTALGPAYSKGAGTVDDHSAEGFNTNRYEQPIKALANVTIDNDQQAISVRGERDHSWGPRPWDMAWQFFVVNTAEFSLQATVVNLPDWPAIEMGYYQTLGGDMEHLSQVDLDVTYAADQPMHAVSGSLRLLCESGREINMRIETISGMEIDITHAFQPAKRTEYRRSLVRCYMGDQDPVIGWLECNRPSE